MKKSISEKFYGVVGTTFKLTGYYEKINNRLTIAKKLYIGLAFTLLLFLAALIFAFIKTQHINQINQSIQEQAAFNAGLFQIQVHVHQQLASIKEWTLTGNEEAFNIAQQSKRASLELGEELISTEDLDRDKREKLEDIIKADKLISSIWEIKLAPMVRDGNYQVAYHSMITEDQPIFQRLLKQTDELVQISQQEMISLQQQAKREGEQAIVVVALFGIMAVVLGILCSVLVVRSINISMAEVITGARRIANGDLTTRINVKTSDEIGALAKGFNDMIDRLNIIVTQLLKNSRYLTENSESLLAGSQNVSSNINMINSTLLDLSNGARIKAQHAAQALEAAVKVEQGAIGGNDTVTAAIEEMTAIQHQANSTLELVQQLKQQSLQIKQMLDVVEGIAGQTNLLSLNASIEAARAGEHGRGFAVVANEVRILADHASQSVKEISEIINSIEQNIASVMEVAQMGARRTARGVEVIHNTGTALQEILESVRSNAALVKQISTATEEVSKNIDQVAAATQEVTSSTEEIANTAGLLDSMAVKLDETVNNFKV